MNGQADGKPNAYRISVSQLILALWYIWQREVLTIMEIHQGSNDESRLERFPKTIYITWTVIYYKSVSCDLNRQPFGFLFYLNIDTSHSFWRYCTLNKQILPIFVSFVQVRKSNINAIFFSYSWNKQTNIYTIVRISRHFGCSWREGIVRKHNTVLRKLSLLTRAQLFKASLA